LGNFAEVNEARHAWIEC